MEPELLYVKIPEKCRKGFRNIAYTHWGDASSNHVLICLHGLSRNSRDFDYLARAMAGKYRVICIDIAGRGRSEWFENKSRYNYHTYVSDVLYLIKELNIKKTDLVGTSMGGIIGMMIAAQKPAIIRKLVLNDIGAYIPGAALDRILSYVGKVPKFHEKDVAKQVMRERMATFGDLDEEHWEHIFKYSIDNIGGGKCRFAYDEAIAKKPGFMVRLCGIQLTKPWRWFKTPDVDLWKLWNKVKAPVLILRGSDSDVLPAKIAEQMKKGRNNVRVTEIRGAGHAPMLMSDMQVEVVKNWLIPPVPNTNSANTPNGGDAVKV